MEKGIVIDFAKSKNFIELNTLLKDYLKKNKAKKNIYVYDYIYPITKLTKKTYEITDHVNLAGVNPLKGPNFISLTNIYYSKNGIIVCSLPKGVHPNKKERNILLKCNVKAYCYNLIPTVIFAVSLGLKIKAFGVVQQANLSH